MAVKTFSIGGFFLRFLFALILVMATFNPAEPYSYYHWAISPILQDLQSFDVFKGLMGVVLIIGWTIYLGATFRALGLFGMLLALLFFGMLIWYFISQGWLSLASKETMTWLVLIVLSAVLAVGISWSHIWRRLTGQLDVDETDT